MLKNGSLGEIRNGDWAHLSPEEKKRRLFEQQKELLDTFLSHGAISPAQYQKSLGDLTVKMGYEK